MADGHARRRPELPAFSLLHDYARHFASAEPGAVALFSDDMQLTYAELPGHVDRYARAFAAAGLRKGDVVGVFSHSRLECFLAFLAAARVGCLYVGLNPKYAVRELAYVLNDCAPKLLLALHGAGEADQDAKLAELMDRVESRPRLVSRDHSLPGGSQTLESFLVEGAWAESRLVEELTAEVRDVNPVAIVYTSGSTGAPKGALLSQRGMTRSARISWETWYGGVYPVRTIAQHPINHVGWLVCECVSAFVAGGAVYFRERFNGVETLKAIATHNLNLWVAFPSMIMLAVESREFATCDLGSLQRVALGSMPAVELMRKLRQKTDAVFSVSYGLTEASGGGLTYTPDDASLEEVATTIGVPIPGAELKIVDEHGRSVGPDEPGELLVRDESLFVGYLNRPDVTAHTIDADGWLHTGDAVAVDQDGKYRMVGRIKEMFKSGGYNVYPTEIEAVLSAHPAVSAACVVEMPDELWSEVGVAFVVPKPGVDVSEDDLRSFCRAELANYKIPKRFLIGDPLPELPNGKFDKVALRERARAIPSVAASA